MDRQFVPSDIAFSLEVFPPKTEANVERLLNTVRVYTSYKPDYISVTFGAGGTGETVDHAREIVGRIAAATSIPVAPHMTCAGRSKDEVNAIIDSFWNDGVRHIVALRGDILSQGTGYAPHPDGYFYTSDFVTGVKKRHPEMKVAVAGYPETHPESPSEAFDIDHLMRKVDAGADAVLTQFFFDPEIFLRWRDKVAAKGIKVHIIPGLLPILNFERMLTFAKKCNASVPGFMHAMFHGVDAESMDHKLLAMNVLSHQITRLLSEDVRRVHFYTLNETLLTRHLCTWLRAAF